MPKPRPSGRSVLQSVQHKHYASIGALTKESWFFLNKCSRRGERMFEAPVFSLNRISCSYTAETGSLAPSARPPDRQAPALSVVRTIGTF